MLRFCFSEILYGLVCHVHFFPEHCCQQRYIGYMNSRLYAEHTYSLMRKVSPFKMARMAAV